jgi:hypothetical protein
MVQHFFSHNKTALADLSVAETISQITPNMMYGLVYIYYITPENM